MDIIIKAYFVGVLWGAIYSLVWLIVNSENMLKEIPTLKKAPFLIFSIFTFLWPVLLFTALKSISDNLVEKGISLYDKGR